MSPKRVDVVIPVLNEAHVLERSVAEVRTYLQESCPCRWRIVIVSNGSTDGTDKLAAELSARHGDVDALTLTERGRGRALRHAWTHGSADAVCYVDVDLSTDLVFLRPLIEAVLEEGYDVATGSRLLPGSRTNRSFRREAISRIYNWIVRFVLRSSVKDAQCGFKALSRTAIELIVPRVEDESWFFDTELLVLAESAGLAVKEIPVVWHEDPDSRVSIVSTAIDDLKGIVRVWRLLRGEAKLAAKPQAGGNA